jgi:hypothetical protein
MMTGGLTLVSDTPKGKAFMESLAFLSTDVS